MIHRYQKLETILTNKHLFWTTKTGSVFALFVLAILCILSLKLSALCPPINLPVLIFEMFQTHVPTIKVCMYYKNISTTKECIWAKVYLNFLSNKPHRLYLKIFNYAIDRTARFSLFCFLVFVPFAIKIKRPLHT